MSTVQTKSRKKRRKEKFWSGSGKFFLSLVLFYLLFLAVSKIIENEKNAITEFAAVDVEINGNQLITKSQILKLCGFGMDKKKQIVVDIPGAARTLLQNKFIKGVSITKRPPRILNITIEERAPVAFIYGKGLNLIDQEGYLIPVIRAEHAWDLPVITGINQSLGKLGNKSTAASAFEALELISYMTYENPLLLGLISEIDMKQPEYFVLTLVRGGARLHLNRNSFSRELFIIKNYLVNYLDWKKLNKIEYIDMRYKNQLVLKYKA